MNLFPRSECQRHDPSLAPRIHSGANSAKDLSRRQNANGMIHTLRHEFILAQRGVRREFIPAQTAPRIYPGAQNANGMIHMLRHEFILAQRGVRQGFIQAPECQRHDPYVAPRIHSGANSAKDLSRRQNANGMIHMLRHEFILAQRGVRREFIPAQKNLYPVEIFPYRSITSFPHPLLKNFVSPDVS